MRKQKAGRFFFILFAFLYECMMNDNSDIATIEVLFI